MEEAGAAVAPASLGMESSAAPEDAVVFVGFSLVIGIACRHLLRGTKVPYTVALLLLGIGIGAIEYGTKNGLGRLGSGIRAWSNINPDLLLFVFLPALLFESSFSMEIHQIKKCLVQMLLLAGPGVLMSTFCLGTAIKVAFPYNWSWKTSLLLGGLLSATDPVAVVALLKVLGASKKLSTIIEGESLMNDGTAIVVYQLFYKMVLGKSFNMGEIIKFLSQVTLGAVALGFAFGIASVLWLGFIFNDTVIEITLTLAVSYLAFFTAQDGADVSGVLAVMTLGMFFAAVAKTAFKGESQQSLHHFWEMVAYIANTLIFILSGVVIAEGILRNYGHLNGMLSRCIVVGLLYPLLRYFGYGLDWKEAIILIWSGLRGAVALSLSLSVKRASDSLDQSHLKPEVGILFLFFTGGIVFLTLTVNGTTTQFILHLLGMDKLTPTKVRVLNYTRYEMLNKAMESFGDLGDDEELGPADWQTVQRYISCLNGLVEGQVQAHGASESETALHEMELKDVRVRLLNGVQAAYWGMLDEGRITQITANLLMQSVDGAMDLVSGEPLCDWKGLKSHVHFPSYYKFLHRFPQKLFTYFTVERLESSCSICGAFLRAHRIARRQLHEFLGDSEISSRVIDESNTEGEEARRFLEEVRTSFPQVLRVVKTRQVTYSILKRLSEYVQNLEKVGLLEEKEMLHLDDAVQKDLKKLLRNPPLVKMPKVKDLVVAHPMLGALPSSVRETLINSSKDIIKIRGSTLYKEGSKPNEIWIISSGIVKWASKTLHNKHSLDPAFPHGSTLGLYEVLTGKPYICDMVTDSVVHCFFIDSEKILLLLRSDPATEDFLWQESSITIAKILHPQAFEKMAMHELRTLIAERSNMSIHIRGEVIEIRTNYIGILLEGFIKTQDDKHDLIASPAVLLPGPTNRSFISPTSSGVTNLSFFSQASSYEVEARARVIVFDMRPMDGEGIGSRRPSSLNSNSMELLHTPIKEHGGLLSWPESMYKAQGHNRSPNGSDDQPTSLSRKAMELSIYGRTANDMRKMYRSFLGSSKSKECQSRSYPRVPSRSPTTKSLLKVQSEGGSLKRLISRDSYSRLSPIPPLPIRNNQPQAAGEDNSSDEEDVIVRIDSPSRLSFPQSSASLFPPAKGH